MAVALQSHPRMVRIRHFVIAVLVVVGGTATAAPRHRRVKAKATLRADAEADAPRHHRSAKKAKRAKHVVEVDVDADVDADVELDADTTAVADVDADVEEAVADAEVSHTDVSGREPDESIHKDIGEQPRRTSRSGWRFAIGPYVWASSVQADVSFGPLTAGVDIGFIKLVKHMRYGAEAAASAQYGRFGIYGDVTYGAAAVGASKEILGVMTSLTGYAGTLLLDSAVGYEVVGGEAAPFVLEARSGVRYQRTTVHGELGAAGFTLSTPDFVDSGTDLVMGARAVLRPMHAIELAGAFDLGVAGDSERTWSATIDAGLRVSKRVAITAGWRSLTMYRSRVNLELSGPRAAMQYLW